MTDLEEKIENSSEGDAATRGWGRLNGWLTLAANVGVVLGLIILIFEVRQNAALTRIGMETDRAAAQATVELRLSDPAIAETWMKSVYTPEALSAADLRIVDGVMVSVTMTWDQLLSMREGGLIDRSRVAQHIGNVAPFFFGSRFGKNWWRLNRVGWQGTEMLEIADPIIAGIDDNFLENYYDELRMDNPRQDPVVSDEAAAD